MNTIAIVAIFEYTFAFVGFREIRSQRYKGVFSFFLIPVFSERELILTQSIY